MPNIHALCGRTGASAAAHLFPQCDKAVTPHLGAPAETFCLNVLLIHLIFHVAQCLTSHCRHRRQGVS